MQPTCLEPKLNHHYGGRNGKLCVISVTTKLLYKVSSYSFLVYIFPCLYSCYFFFLIYSSPILYKVTRPQFQQHLLRHFLY